MALDLSVSGLSGDGQGLLAIINGLALIAEIRERAAKIPQARSLSLPVAYVPSDR
jgi:hypothetical protein